MKYMYVCKLMFLMDLIQQKFPCIPSQYSISQLQLQYPAHPEHWWALASKVLDYLLSHASFQKEMNRLPFFSAILHISSLRAFGRICTTCLATVLHCLQDKWQGQTKPQTKPQDLNQAKITTDKKSPLRTETVSAIALLVFPLSSLMVMGLPSFILSNAAGQSS